MSPRLDWKAVASPVCGIITVLSWFRLNAPREECIISPPSRGWLIPLFLCPIVALYLGHRSRGEIRRRTGDLKGQVLATAGLVFSYALIFYGLVLAPRLVSSSQSGRESRALTGVRMIIGAESAFVAKGHGYGKLTDLIEAELLDRGFNAVRHCYRYGITVSDSTYAVSAIPISSDAGRYGYYAEADGIVRYSTAVSLSPEGFSGKPVQ
jgi:hypothetical protein